MMRLQNFAAVLNLRQLAVKALNGSLAVAVALAVISFITIPSQAQSTYRLLYTFTSTDGGSYSNLVRLPSGKLYGTTISGVAQGAIFELANRQQTVLYSFTGGADGSQPYAGLIQDAAGNFYGTTYSSSSPSTFGAVFKLDSSGTFTVLHTFLGGTDGANPYAGVIRDSAGNLYGTTYRGGSFNDGTVFKIDAAGNETLLHTFAGGADGANPVGNLYEDAAGNLYGTTFNGGLNNSSNGVLFKIDAAGTFSVLHTFLGTSGTRVDCGNPFAGVIQDKAGNLYGSTFYGGVTDTGCIYRLAPSGRETVLYSFGMVPDGSNPTGLIQDPSGNLYGTTSAGGAGENGIVFKLDKSGSETILYTFTGGFDGGQPYNSLVRDSTGNLYGTASTGGPSNYGTVFELTFP
jgi:uncharacterized repeat protein (TIGR03803 family)